MCICVHIPVPLPQRNPFGEGKSSYQVPGSAWQLPRCHDDHDHTDQCDQLLRVWLWPLGLGRGHRLPAVVHNVATAIAGWGDNCLVTALQLPATAGNCLATASCLPLLVVGLGSWWAVVIAAATPGLANYGAASAHGYSPTGTLMARG